MEMEMDIPLPEELEWLESNALHEEEQEDFEELIEEDFEGVQDPKSISPENSKKRRLHPDVVVVEGVSRSSPDEKKIRTAASSPEAVPDEEWLRYSPREDPVVVDDGGGDDDPVAGVVEEKLLSRFASEINGPSISVTGPCGDRVYSMMRHDEAYGGDRRRLNLRTSSKGLLSEPMNVLMEKVEQEALNKALQASFGASNDPMDEAVPISTEKLWVEKYAPSSFTELLSDEQTNREVLLWLKQWDNCVFGSQIRATSNDVLSALKRHSSVAQQNKFSDFRILSSKSNGFPLRNQNFKLSDALNEEKNNLKELWNKKTAANGSPEQKINASDDRSSSTIESKILDVVQMDSVMADSKPKCLVIDEIDGALGEGKGAVEVILKMVASDRKSAIKVGDAAEESQPGKASLKRNSRRATLLRPVICICNDLYAPALRPLRQVAKLKYICNKEGFKASGIGLSALAEYTGKFGDYDLTMEGIYENFLHLSYHDPLMQKTGKCLDFLGGSDTLLQYIMRTQQMFLYDVVSLLLHVLSPSTLRPREAVSDASMLLLDPPIEHFISFKDYQTGHCILSSAIKQVLLHEIEKRKILRENGGQPVHPSAESNSDQPLRTEDIGAFSNKMNTINSSIKSNRENPNCALTHESLKAGASPNSILRDNKCGTANGVKVKAPTIANRRSSSSSFFDRFRKLSGKGSEIPDDYQQKPATMERDSRPFLFKYNEGFTNAVKRPVRIRELLP
ncbi:hypothetical protein QJS10_CPA06g00029 [Acorus calamus]|uniref:Uncharacterized protein n=1 Tax=Acorus calamus TaxID=4465 RepID=A0AAV9EN74_ACOCL|nr:hypothetical protein QJS10_CPA06g00029 [Acorus calamus]